MTTVVVSAFGVVNYPEGGGHFWAYMQYVQGLLELGCDVYWLESLRSRRHLPPRAENIAEFARRMERYGLAGKFILYESHQAENGGTARQYSGMRAAEAEAVFRRADLLLNFNYRIDPDLLSRFRRTALVDIDPSVLQSWIGAAQLALSCHDVYLTIGETVGKPGAGFPDCGIAWRHIRPPVSLARWPATPSRDDGAFTTVSSWWSYDWLKDADGHEYDNNKRVTFLEFLDLPRFTSQPMELALYFGPTLHDLQDRQLLEGHGWRVRHSLDVASTPEAYQGYVQQSRGEFSCAKPAYVRYRTAWISDRTLCYLASGKPAVVQDTGPSSFLPHGRGIFRFSTRDEAVGAFDAIHRDYEGHCQAAREIAEAYFDARQVAENILNEALGRAPTPVARAEKAAHGRAGMPPD